MEEAAKRCRGIVEPSVVSEEITEEFPVAPEVSEERTRMTVEPEVVSEEGQLEKS